jgi:hypothetical protein
VRSGPGKNGQEPKKKRSTVVSSKKKWTEMNPIRRRMKKCNPSSGQNGQLVHWWLLVHFGLTPSLFNGLAKFKQMRAQNVRPTTSPSLVKELASSKE